MRTILFILQKEFIQILRNKIMLPIIIMMPIVQLVILVYAVTYEIKEIRFYVVDQDLSSTSRKLTSKFESSPFFKLTGSSFSLGKAEDALYKNEATLVIHFPDGFERKLIRENKSELQIIVNAINANVAALSNAYTQTIIRDFNEQMVSEWYNITTIERPATINSTYSYWYNQQMDYKIFMAPGILVMLATAIGLFMAGINIVREKEIGTIEQINVTPIRKYQFIIGKLLPFLIIGLVEISIGMLIANLLFKMPIIGSLVTIYAFATIYMIIVLSMGLLISTITHTQQQSMFLTWFCLVIFILMSGLFTPIESMPHWAQVIDYLNPLTYFIRVIRLVMLKGAGFYEVRDQFAIMISYAIGMVGLAVWRYKKVS